MYLNRRQALKSFFAVTAGVTGFGFKSATANELAKFMGQVDIGTAPVRKPKIFNALEIMIGEPTQYLPKSVVLKDVFKTKMSKFKYMAVSHVPGGRLNRFRDWQEVLDDVKSADYVQQLETINSFINSYQYISDEDSFRQQQDVWETPDVFFRRGGGDCEDFAITKLASLRALGYHPERLRLVIVDDQLSGQRHAVLAVFLEGQIFILDNKFSKVVSQDIIRSYAPVCSMNSQCLWLHMQKGQKIKSTENITSHLTAS